MQAEGLGATDHGVEEPADDEISSALAEFETRLRASAPEMRTQCLDALRVLGEALRDADSQATLLVCNGATEILTLVKINASDPQLEEMLDFIHIFATGKDESLRTLH